MTRPKLGWGSEAHILDSHNDNMGMPQEQRVVFDWLRNDLNLPVFAAAYKGAVQCLNSKAPGYITFVAHTGRDFVNILPQVTGIIESSSRVDYPNHLNKLQSYWRDDWRDDRSLTQGEDQSGHLIPGRVCQIVADLIDDHRAGQKRGKDRDFHYFSGFLEYDDRNKVPENFMREWQAATRWFVKHAHLRKENFPTITAELVETHFRTLDNFLYIAASSALERLRGLNDILDETNG